MVEKIRWWCSQLIILTVWDHLGMEHEYQPVRKHSLVRKRLRRKPVFSWHMGPTKCWIRIKNIVILRNTKGNWFWTVIWSITGIKPVDIAKYMFNYLTIFKFRLRFMFPAILPPWTNGHAAQPLFSHNKVLALRRLYFIWIIHRRFLAFLHFRALFTKCLRLWFDIHVFDVTWRSRQS